MEQLSLIKGEDTLLLLEPHEAPALWHKIEEYIRQACAHGGNKFAPHHWLARVLSGQADLFVSPSLETAVIAEPQGFPLVNVYVVVLLGGEGGCDWDSYQTPLESRCKALGCTVVEVYGRPGWKKILESHGMKMAHYVWRKEIE